MSLTCADTEQTTLDPANNVSAKSDTAGESNGGQSVTSLIASSSALDDIVQRFWESEEPPKCKISGPEDEVCERKFKSGTYRTPEESCRGDYNAMPGCDEKCRKRCPGDEPIQCKCVENGCECKDGFVFEPVTYKCILPSQCNITTTTSTEKSLVTQTTTELSTTLTTKTNESYEVSTNGPIITTEKQSNTTQYSKDENSTTHRPEISTAESVCETNSESKSTTEVRIGLTTLKELSTADSTEEIDSTTPTSQTTDESDTLIHITGDFSGWTTQSKSESTASTETSTFITTTVETSTTSLMPTTPEPSCEDIGYELFAKGNLEYTAKILNDLVQTKPGNNVLCGGASILYLMAQLAVQAKDTAKKELLKVLNLKETDQMCRCGGRSNLNYLLMGLFKSNIAAEQIRCVLPKISANLTASYPDIEYDLFCKIYADDSCALTDYFIRSTTQVFVIGPENIDFSAKNSARNISDTVAQYTNDAFVNYIKPNTLSALNGLILVDAEAFMGKWEKQFDPAFTTMVDFNRNGRIDKIPTMNQRASFLYADSSVLNAKVLRMKYTQKEFSLTIFLPNRIDGLNDMLKRMENPDTVLSVIETLRLVDVEVYIPKFSISVANRLKNPSIKANIKEIFNENSTGLEDIASCDNPFVSDILQKVTFQVDELGLGDRKDIDFPDPEDISPSRPQAPQLFKADHPFVYYLFYNKVALIAGVFAR
uniref:Serpin domain-containing protein n=1 Tax=Heliothis virescens TaxID=7102 RepID=A0A2A4J8D0_HELVI